MTQCLDVPQAAPKGAEALRAALACTGFRRVGAGA